MSVQQINDALLGEVFEVLDSSECFLSRLRHDAGANRIVDSIMQVRSKLIVEHPQNGLYSAALLGALLEHAVDAIVIIDHNGVITSFNPSAEQMFGYAAGEMVGQKVNALMPSPYSEQHDDYITRYMQTGEAKVIGLSRDAMGKRKDGATFPVHLALSHVRVGADDFYAGFLREIDHPTTDG